jgi:predicted ribosomally synthesized peptide with SipW-like signal peptide
MSKKIALSLMAIALVSSLVGMATFALFTATASNTSNTFTAGTVSLGAPNVTGAVIDPMAPGDSGTLTYSIQYTGNLDAFLGIKRTLSGDLASGATPLAVTASAFEVNGAPVVAASDRGYDVVKVSNGSVVTMTLNYALPLDADNSYQGKTATLTVEAKAVQQRNNDAGDHPNSWN